MPSSGVSRCRTSVAGHGRPVGRRERARLARRSAAGSWPRRLLAVPLGALAGAEVDVGPHRRVDVGLVDHGDAGGLEVLVVGLGDACPLEQRVDDEPGGVERVERQRRAAGAAPRERKPSTTWVAKASTRSSRSSGSSGRTGSQACGPGRPRAGPGSGPAGTPRRRRWSRRSSVSVPSGSTACSAWYSTPGRRPPTERGGSRGRCASSTHTSLVSRFSDQITTSPPLRVARTSSSKRSSGSSSTSTSSSYDVPERVPPDLERPVGLVVHRVEEVRRVGAPGAAVVGARHRRRPGPRRSRGRGSAARRPRRRSGPPSRRAAARPG